MMRSRNTITINFGDSRTAKGVWAKREQVHVGGRNEKGVQEVGLESERPRVIPPY